jgi:hypothetical protein
MIKDGIRLCRRIEEQIPIVQNFSDIVSVIKQQGQNIAKKKVINWV